MATVTSSRKEKILEALKHIKFLRFKTSHSTLLTVTLLTLIFCLAITIRMLPLRWGLYLSEFDPFFQFHFARYVEEHGFLAWTTWHDTQRWFPHGVNVARAAFPGLPLTAAFFHSIIVALGVPIDLWHFCIVWPPIMGAITCLVMYFLGKDFGGKTVGLFSAFLLALSPPFIMRTSLGFFDDETIGIFSMLLFTFFFLRSLDKERSLSSTMKYAVASGLILGYFCAGWGAAFYPIGLTALFVLALIFLKRYSRRLLLSYSVTFGLGLFIATNVPKLSIRYLFTGPILQVFAVFLLLCLCEILRVTKTRKWKIIYTAVFFLLMAGMLVGLTLTGFVSGIAGKFISVLNPFERLGVPLIESVQEHRVTAWASFYYDFGIGVFFFALGLFFLVGNLTNRNLFLLIYGITALYFACSMVRLTILLAPAFCILWAVGLVGVLKPFVTLLREKRPAIIKKKYAFGYVGKEFSAVALILSFLLLTVTIAFPLNPAHSVFSSAYSPVTIYSGSVPIRPREAVDEWTFALEWMEHKLPDDAIILAWWDYGYWITIKANKTTLADNATLNTTQIALIGKIFMSNETEALKIMNEQFHRKVGNPPESRRPTHVLVFITFNSEDNLEAAVYGDEGKWRWMAKIAKQRFPDMPSDTAFGNYTIGYDSITTEDGKQQKIPCPKGQETLFYKLVAYAKHDKFAKLPGAELTYFKKAYFTDGGPYYGIHIMVCLYEIDWEAYEAANPT